MSFLKYFEPVKDKAKGKCSDANSIALSLFNKVKNGTSRDKLTTISDIDGNNKSATSSKRTVYEDKDKIRISRHACENGNSKVVSKFKSDFSKLNESTIKPWVEKYNHKLSSK